MILSFEIFKNQEFIINDARLHD